MSVSIPFGRILSEFVAGVEVVSADVLIPILGAATLLGITTLVSVFVIRRIHFIVSIVFFGLATVVAVTGVMSDILSGLSYATTGAALARYIPGFGFVLLNISGLVIEIICDRKSRMWTRLR